MMTVDTRCWSWDAGIPPHGMLGFPHYSPLATILRTDIMVAYSCITNPLVI